jgi:hypothetical protein
VQHHPNRNKSRATARRREHHQPRQRNEELIDIRSFRRLSRRKSVVNITTEVSKFLGDLRRQQDRLAKTTTMTSTTAATTIKTVIVLISSPASYRIA